MEEYLPHSITEEYISKMVQEGRNYRLEKSLLKLSERLNELFENVIEEIDKKIENGEDIGDEVDMSNLHSQLLAENVCDYAISSLMLDAYAKITEVLELNRD